MATVDSREDDFGVLPATIEHLYATGLVWLYVSTVPSIPRVWAATSREVDSVRPMVCSYMDIPLGEEPWIQRAILDVEK